MGVMLSLDRPTLARSRRQARHARRPDDQAWAETLAGIFRDDVPHAGGCLVRLAKTFLPARLLPASAGPAGGGPGPEQQDARPADHVPGGRLARAGRGLSGACLLGQCEDSPGAPACASAACEHDCHDRVPVRSANGAPAA
jgi:hypothetical protein